MKFKTIYLTGAPASGKSSTSASLAEITQPLQIWEYGARLTEFVQKRGDRLENQSELRAKSSRIVTPEDIAELDRQLIAFVEERRCNTHILIDSHPATKEDYGFRVTAFSQEQVLKLKPDEIWVLFTPPEVAVERIALHSAGRPMISIEEARMHTQLQASVATTYGVALGRPVYFFDTSTSQDEVVRRLSGRLGVPS